MNSPPPSTSESPTIPPISPRSFLLGGLAGLVVAVAGAFAWVKLTSATGKVFGAAAVLIGLLTGGAVRWGTKQGGIIPGFLGGLFTLGALLGAHYFIILDILTKTALAQGYRGVKDLSLFDALRSLNGWAWLFVAMGVYFAFTIPLGPRPNASANR
jgi:hypothetical protein